MSREEFGTATTRTGAPLLLRPRRALPTTGGAMRDVAAARRPTTARRRVAVVAACLVAVAVGALAGRAGVQVWDSTPEPVTDVDGPVAWAVVEQERTLSGDGDVQRVSFVVRVTDLAREPLVVDGAQGGFDAAKVSSVTPVGVTARPGRTVTVTVTVTVSCRSPQALRVPPLQVRRAGHLRDAVELQGAGDTLARVCSAGDPRRAVVLVRSAETDGDRLRLLLTAPTGRTTRVVGAHTGTVRLTGRLPISLDATDTVLWLDPPRECPAQWAAGGLPRTLVLDLDTGSVARLPVDVGPALARWLLAGPCRSVR